MVPIALRSAVTETFALCEDVDYAVVGSFIGEYNSLSGVV